MNGRQFMRKSIGLFLISAIAPALLAQTGSIQGVVVRGTNDPLSKARVELRRDNADSGVLDTVVTEEDGRFSFQNVQQGRYRIAATRQGYLRSPLTIDIVAGQQVAGLQLPMKTTGAIYGSVADGQGNSLGNIDVQALRASYASGRRVLTPVQSARTNDLGEYRLFWLPPGRYYIVAVPPEAASMMSQMLSIGGMAILGGTQRFQSRADVDPALGPYNILELLRPAEGDRHAPTYFANVLDEQSASPIDLRAGADFGSVNITIMPVLARHVRGIILDENGRVPNYPNVRPATDNPMSLPPGTATKIDKETGAFDMTLLPGTHLLKATSEGASGFAMVRVGDADIESVLIRTSTEFNIKGHISVEGRPVSASDLGRLHLTLVRDLPVRLSTNSYSVPLEDGSITLGAGIGDFKLNISPILNVDNSAYPTSLPAALRDAYVKSIRLGDIDVLNGGFHLEKRTDARLEIVLGTNPGNVAGTVVRDAQQPAGDVTVVLVPNVRLRTDLYKTTVSDPSGRFRFDRVPPGQYKVFAWTDVENGAWLDPEFIANDEGRGQAIRVEEGMTANISVTAVP